MTSLSSQTFPPPLSSAAKPGGGRLSLAWCVLAAACFLALPCARAQLAVTITSPPQNISVVAGTPLPLAASVINLTPDRTVTQIQFIFNGVPQLQFPLRGPFIRQITAPTAPGSYKLQLRVLDRLTGDTSDTADNVTLVEETVTVVPPDTNDPAPTARLLTDLTGRSLLAGTSVVLTGTAQSLRPDGGPLGLVVFYADNAVVAAFDSAGNPVNFIPGNPGASGGILGDVTDNGPAANGTAYRAPWTVPTIDTIINLTVVATTATGRSQVSTVVPVHVTTDTSDQPPAVAISSLTNGEQFPVNSALNVAVSVKDPDPQFDPATHATLPTGVISEVSYYINNTRVGTSLAPPFGFPYTLNAAGTYVINSIATDGAGLSGVADPVILQVVAPTVVSLVKPKDRRAVEGQHPLKLRVLRTGDLSGPLTVTYRLAGGAVSGVDYVPLTGTAIFPAGAARVKIKIRALNDGFADGNKTLKLILTPDPNGAYILASPIRVNARLINVN